MSSPRCLISFLVFPRCELAPLPPLLVYLSVCWLFGLFMGNPLLDWLCRYVEESPACRGGWLSDWSFMGNSLLDWPFRFGEGRLIVAVTDWLIGRHICLLAQVGRICRCVVCRFWKSPFDPLVSGCLTDYVELGSSHLTRRVRPLSAFISRWEWETCRLFLRRDTTTK